MAEEEAAALGAEVIAKIPVVMNDIEEKASPPTPPPLFSFSPPDAGGCCGCDATVGEVEDEATGGGASCSRGWGVVAIPPFPLPLDPHLPAEWRHNTRIENPMDKEYTAWSGRV